MFQVSPGLSRQASGYPTARRTPSPPPPAIDTSPAHVTGYLVAVLRAWLAGRPLPEYLLAGQEVLTLEGYLTLEKSLPSAVDEQHIHHKLLYDAASQALIKIYSKCRRVQVSATGGGIIPG